MSKSKDSRTGTWFLFLFALPFAGVGVGAGVWLAMDIGTYVQTKYWDRIPCAIEQLDLQTNHDSDSTTYRVVATFSYRYLGHRYVSDRVAISGGSDNIGSFHRDLHQRLHSDRLVDGSFCYVNPRVPQEAILDRTLRWEMLLFKSTFMLVFGGFGFGLTIGTILSKRQAKEERQLAAEHPDEPWLQRAEWQHTHIESNNRSGLKFLVVFAAFWNAISWPAVIFAADDIIKGDWLNPAWLALLFPLIGSIMIIMIVVEWLRLKKYGNVYFEMRPFPGILGGPVSGVIVIPRHMRCEKGFRTRLQHIHRFTTGSGKNRSTHENVIWEDVRLISRELIPDNRSNTVLPVLFAAPFDQRESKLDSGDGYYWKLEASADVPGLDLESEFEIPVFKTKNSNPNFLLKEDEIEAHEVQRGSREILADVGIELMPTIRGTTLSFPPARNLKMNAGLGLFTIIWTGICVALWFSDAPRIFPISFSFFGILIGWGFLDSLLFSSRLVIDGRTWMIERGWLGLGKSEQVFADDIMSVEKDSSMQSGHKTYYNILLRKKNGDKPVLVAKYIAPLTVVKEIEGELTRRLPN